MDDVKKLIRSFLISSPLEMTISKLDKDYHDEIGERIPFQKFGYGSLEQFLHAMPDIVEVRGHGRDARLIVIADQKVAHIDRLVSLQRPPNIKKPRFGSRPRRRCSGGLPSYKKPLLPSCNYTPPGAYNLSPYQQLSSKPLVPNLTCVNYQYQPFAFTSVTTIPTSSLSSFSGAIPKRRTDFKQNTLPKRKDTEILNTTEHNSFVNTNIKKLPEPEKKNLPVKTTNSHLHKEETNLKEPSVSSNIDKELSDDHGDVVYYSEGEDNFTDEEKIIEPAYEEETIKPIYEEAINMHVPFKIQENLKTFILKHNGIWCRDVPKLYKEIFKKPLDYEEYGYRSLAQMCLELENIFYCYRPSNGDFILYDNTKPLSEDFKKQIEQQHLIKCNQTINKLVESDNIEPALVGVEEYAKDVDVWQYPDDVMIYEDEIPHQFSPDNFKENSFIDVVVGEIYDPSKFWIILKDYGSKLDTLMDNMQYFYDATSSDLLIPQNMLREGLYCVANYNQEYHRAVIVRMNQDSKTIKIFFVDYGTISTANPNGLLFLHKQFSSFPRQAIRARLASIWPTTAFTPWSIAASSRFLSLVRQKELVAHIYKIHEETKILEIFLADTSTDEDIYMNDTLVNEGYALFTNQVKDIKNNNQNLLNTNTRDSKPQLLKPPSPLNLLKALKASKKSCDCNKKIKQFGLKDVLNAIEKMTV